MTTRKEIYGKKKAFILDHFDDILEMRKRMSARKVADVYGGVITMYDIYKVEQLIGGV